MSLTVGMTNTVYSVVTEDKTAASARSGSLPVFATPFMVALMEEAASSLCEKETDDGITTVGTALSIEHLAATAVGAEVRATAKVTAVEGRKISFEVEAYDNAGLIGKGTHERFSVKSEKFLAKAEERKAL
mgnify:CR=1 FL=1